MKTIVEQYLCENCDKTEEVCLCCPGFSPGCTGQMTKEEAEGGYCSNCAYIYVK